MISRRLLPLSLALGLCAVAACDFLSDKVAPTLTLNGEATMHLKIGETYSEPGATATDNRDGDLTFAIARSGVVDTRQRGTYTVRYTVADKAGNQAGADRTVFVESSVAAWEGQYDAKQHMEGEEFVDGEYYKNGKVRDTTYQVRVEATANVDYQLLVHNLDNQGESIVLTLGLLPDDTFTVQHDLQTLPSGMGLQTYGDGYVGTDLIAVMNLRYIRARADVGHELERGNLLLSRNNAPLPDAGMPAGPDAGFEGPLTDARDGKEYPTVRIGSLTWMAKNLDYAATGARCLGDDPAKCDAYGHLYTWEQASAACPDGWHLPSKDEWTALGDAVGAATAGTQLKSAAMGGTDDYGFAVLGAGYCLENGACAYEGTDANFWSSTEISASTAWHFFFVNTSPTLNQADSDTKAFAYSVRCVR